MDAPENAAAEPGPSALATIELLVRAVARAQEAAATPSSWTLWPPAPDGSQRMQFADPADPRCAGGGALVLSAEALRPFPRVALPADE